MMYTESPRRKRITQQVAWGHWFALANIIMAVIISSVYLFATPVANTPLSFIYSLLTWFGHMSFVTFLVFVIVILPLCYQVTNMRVLRGIGAVVSAVGLALLAFDALVYNNTGFHISFSSAALLRSETQVQVGAFSWLQWFYLALLFIIWLMFQLVVANAIYQRLERLQRLHIGSYITTALVICFVTSHAIHVWADARLYTPVLKQDNMFPLSYPATAKTLMARYGLLDLEDRQQREDLQILGVGNRFVYPPQNVYCSVNAQKKVAVLISQEPLSAQTLLPLTPNSFHLNTQSSKPDAMLKHLQYGIPYHLVERTSSPPVMLDLLKAFDVPHLIYQGNSDSSMSGMDFQEQLVSASNGLFMGFMQAEEFSSLDIAGLTQSTSLMVLAPDDNGHYRLFSNISDEQQASTNEDIAPTVMREFECMAEVYRFSTGQALQAPSRKWLVSTMNSNILFLNAPYLTEVASDGSYKVIDIRDQSEVLIDIDTNMLSRSIKHLENFVR